MVASVRAAVGVSVAKKVVPPSLLLTVERVPLAMVKSSLLNPVTGSLNVKLTEDVSPAARDVSATTTVTVGPAVSTTMLLLAPSDPDALGAGSVNVALLLAASVIVPELSAKAVVLA